MPGISATVAPIPDNARGQPHSVSKIASMFQSMDRATNGRNQDAQAMEINRGRSIHPTAGESPRSLSMETKMESRKLVSPSDSPAVNSTAAVSLNEISDATVTGHNRSKFSSTRAMFENLDKASFESDNNKSDMNILHQGNPDQQVQSSSVGGPINTSALTSAANSAKKDASTRQELSGRATIYQHSHNNQNHHSGAATAIVSPIRSPNCSAATTISPRDSAGVAALTSAAPFRAPTASVAPFSPRSPPPPVPPKPSRLTVIPSPRKVEDSPSSTASYRPPVAPVVGITSRNGANNADADRTVNSTSIQSASESRTSRSPRSGESATAREDSPLTEMTKRFNELVDDLEKMTTPKPAVSSVSASNSPSAAEQLVSTSSKLFLNRGSSSGGSAPVSVTASPPAAMRYPRLTQTLNMEKAQQQPTSDNSGTAGSLSKPSSLYEPYWRQHSWYKKRYESPGTSPEPPSFAADSTTDHDLTPTNNSVKSEAQEARVTRNFELNKPSSTAVSSQPFVPTTSVYANKDNNVSATTYGLFRTRRISEETSSSDERSSRQPSVEPMTKPVAAPSVRSINAPNPVNTGAVIASNFVKYRGPQNTVSPVPEPPSRAPKFSPNIVVDNSVGKAVTTKNAVDFMTKEEQSVLLSSANRYPDSLTSHASTSSSASSVTNGTVISQATDEVRPLSSHLHLPQDVDGSKRLSQCSVDSAVEQMLSSSSSLQSPEKAAGDPVVVKWLEGGHYMLEINGLSPVSMSPPPIAALSVYKPPEKVSFSTDPIKVYSTHSGLDYDRRNEDIDPVSASAEYELERRLEKMDVFDVELQKGNEGLGFSIIGMGVGADAGLEKLGIFVKSITPGGAVYKDGKIQVCDQIVEVDGQSLVGVTQAFAASVLRSTQGTVNFRIGREHNLEASEIAMLIRQSIDQDRMRAQQQEFFQQLHRQPDYGSPRMSQEEDDETSTATPTPSVDGDGPESGGYRKPSEDATPEPMAENQPEIDHLLNQLRKPEDETKIESHELQEISPSVEEKKSAFHSEPSGTTEARSSDGGATLSGEMSQILQESLEESVARMQVTNGTHGHVHGTLNSHGSHGSHSSGDSSPASSRRSGHASSGSYPYSSEEKEIQAKIKILESQLFETKHQATEFQGLLSASQSHYDDLEKKYQKAKRMLKDYQDRERELLEREEAHLKQLREKDQQYNNLVKQLKTKISDLEDELSAAHKKRASIVEAQQNNSSELLDELKKQASIAKVFANEDSQTVTHSGSVCKSGEPRKDDSSTTTDISPALAYQPSRKLPSGSNSVPESVDKLSEDAWDGRKRRAEYVVYRRHPDMGIPETELLDSRAAKSKAEAVRQSQIMASRQLPSKRPETEVLIVCHHTAEHAEEIRCASGSNAGQITESESDRESTLKIQNSCHTYNQVSSPSRSVETSISTSASPMTPRKLAPGFLRKRHPNKDLEASREAEIVHAMEVVHWSCDNVCKFLKALGLEKYIPEFTVNKVDGGKFLQLDGTRLKAMGVQNHSDRSIIKKRIKEIKGRIEKERKVIEKESRQIAKMEKKSFKQKR